MLLIPLIIFSQDLNIKSVMNMSDAQLMNYWESAQEQGYTIEQIKTLAKVQGVSDSDVNMLEKRINNFVLSPGSNTSSDSEISQTSEFGVVTEQSLEAEKESSIIFGSNFFNNPDINSTPQFNVATPSSYELGPGDELSISIWGAAENEFTSNITRDGYLKIERIGPVYLSGLTISEAKYKLESRLSKIYSGLKSNVNKVFFDLSLLKTRSIVVNITGNVIGPGTYTLSSLSNPLNALYAAGGPSDNGSFRDIKIIRGQKEVHSVDLYDYFVKGELVPFSLKDQDVILVPTYKNRILAEGSFKEKGLFELKENETINDLLFFSGGISSLGYKEKVFINRVNGLNRENKSVSIENYKNFKLKDGDNIEARATSGQLINTVSVEGAINVPGSFELEKNQNISDLIESAGGLREDAFKARAYLIREINGIPQEAETVDLNNSKGYALKNNDNLFIPSLKDLTVDKTVTISGEIKEAGDYPFFNGMTAVDLILMSKGLTESGSNNGITIYRSTYDKTKSKPIKTINFDLNDGYKNLTSEQNIILKPNDLMIIREKEGFQGKESVSVQGLVNKPGNYALLNNNYSVYDLIQDFEGFLPDAELEGVKIKRIVNVDKITKNELEGLDIDKYIEVGLNIKKIMESNGGLDKFNLTLKNGDEIIVPKTDNSVEINGEVQKPTAITYYPGLNASRAINNAGGFSSSAKKSAVYVVYQNGSVKTVKSFLIFKNYPKLLPGSKIVVPKKPETTSKTSVGEIVGYTTSLVSIIALINSL